MLFFGRIALVCVGVTSPIAGAFAATAQSQITMSLSLIAECRVAVNTSVNFGTLGLITVPQVPQGQISVRCTNGQSYTLGLDNGLNMGSTRRMRLGATSEYVAYELYPTAAYATPWNMTTSVMSNVGSGSSQLYQVYARLPVQSAPAAGAYSDTVTVTVTY
ncbi:MAG: spore Coat Protein domain protein [Hyphomicrobiales bacterium]|nr:spore Coat Protein domain protein [Hyphomicrobiales bacterium]